MERWINQFDAGVQLPILREMAHVLKKTYFSRARTVRFLSGLFQTKKLVGDNPCAFWKGVNFLDIQGGGASQTQMLALFSKLLKAKCGFEISECGTGTEIFVYLDDVTFTGSRVKQDIERWIVREAPAKATVHIIMIAIHTGAKYYAEQHTRGNILSAAKAAGKKSRSIGGAS